MTCETSEPSTTGLPLSLPPLIAIDSEFARRSLGEFIAQAWHVIEPQTPFIPGWHLDAIVEHLEAVTAGQIRNLLINMPPRHMKSLAVSVFWPVWEWITKPATRWLYSSYALSLSIRDSLKCRRLIESPWFTERWGDKFTLTSDQNAKMRYDNDKGGYRIATSVGGAATGEGGSRVVVDDPHNVIERESAPIREAALTWWDETMSTRLNDPKLDAKVIVMQRVHQKDLSGHVLEQGGYVHLCLPAEYEPSRKCSTSIGWSDPRTRAGELLWAERIGIPEISDFKLRLGSVGYAGQFQQSPNPDSDSVFRREWFRYWKPEGEFYRLMVSGADKLVRIADCNRFMVADIAGVEKRKPGHDPDYTVLQIWDLTPSGDLVLVDQWRGQVQTTETEDAIIRIVGRYDIMNVNVEHAHVGIGVIQHVRKRGIAVRGLSAHRSKLVRSQVAQIRTEAGTVFFPVNHRWVTDEFEPEVQSFTGTDSDTHDDQVDCLSYAGMLAQRLAGALTNEKDDSRNARHAELESKQETASEQSDDERRDMALARAHEARSGEMWAGFDGDDDD